MNARLRGAIDCDVHPSVPSVRELLPYLDDYWRDMIEVRDLTIQFRMNYERTYNLQSKIAQRLRNWYRKAEPKYFTAVDGISFSVGEKSFGLSSPRTSAASDWKRWSSEIFSG